MVMRTGLGGACTVSTGRGGGGGGASCFSGGGVATGARRNATTPASAAAITAAASAGHIQPRSRGTPASEERSSPLERVTVRGVAPTLAGVVACEGSSARAAIGPSSCKYRFSAPASPPSRRRIGSSAACASSHVWKRDSAVRASSRATTASSSGSSSGRTDDGGHTLASRTSRSVSRSSSPRNSRSSVKDS